MIKTMKKALDVRNKCKKLKIEEKEKINEEKTKKNKQKNKKL